MRRGFLALDQPMLYSRSGCFDFAILEIATPDQASAQREFHILPDHAYQVAAVIHNDADGLDYGVVRDPFGFDHPSPIPLSRVNDPFLFGQIARFNK
jgi:hypothetical protein